MGGSVAGAAVGDCGWFPPKIAAGRQSWGACEAWRGPKFNTCAKPGPWRAEGCSSLCPLPSAQCFAQGGQLWLGCSPCLSIGCFGAPPVGYPAGEGCFFFLGGGRIFAALQMVQTPSHVMLRCRITEWKWLCRASCGGAGAEPKNQRDAPNSPVWDTSPKGQSSVGPSWWPCPRA